MAGVADPIILTGGRVRRDPSVVEPCTLPGEGDILTFDWFADYPIGAGGHHVLDHIDIIVAVWIVTVPTEFPTLPDNVHDLVGIAYL